MDRAVFADYYWNLTLIVDRAPFHWPTPTERPILYYPFHLHTEFIYLEENSLTTIFQLDNRSKNCRGKGRNFLGDVRFSRKSIFMHTHTHAYIIVHREINAVWLDSAMRRWDENVVARWLNDDGGTTYQGKLLSFLAVSGEFEFVRGTRCHVKRISAKSTGNVS